MLITSKSNKKIKTYLKLKNKKMRDELGLFLIEGEHLVKEALNTDLIEDILVLENTNLTYDREFLYVTKEIMKMLSNLETLPNVIAVLKIPKEKEIKGDRVLLLDDIQDPGNLGTIIRSSLAFNTLDIVLNNNSVDLYNEKVIRSTQGMIFKVNIVRRDLSLVIKELKEKGYLVLGTNVKDGIDVKDIKTNKFALLMGNEGQGVKKELLNMCDKNLYIKMNKECESLNVGVATSILLYELNR